MVSSGGVISMSLSDTYPAVLIRILGNALSVRDDDSGATNSLFRESKADRTESGDVMSHSKVRTSSSSALPKLSLRSSSLRAASNGA